MRRLERIDRIGQLRQGFNAIPFQPEPSRNCRQIVVTEIGPLLAHPILAQFVDFGAVTAVIQDTNQHV